MGVEVCAVDHPAPGGLFKIADDVIFCPMRIIQPHEVWLNTLQRVCKRGPHTPIAMRSGQSKGPIKMYICDICQTVEHSISYDAPVCAGSSRTFFK